jgi:hypothetical protein
MNAPELAQQVEAVGGTLSIKGNRIRYDLPERPKRWWLNSSLA